MLSAVAPARVHAGAFLVRVSFRCASRSSGARFAIPLRTVACTVLHFADSLGFYWGFTMGTHPVIPKESITRLS